MKLSDKEKSIVRKTPFNELMLELIEEDDETKIIDIIDKYRLNGNSYRFKTRIFDFVLAYYPHKQYLIDELKNKVDNYFQSKKEKQTDKKQKIRKLDSMKKYLEIKIYIEEFINSDCLKKSDYCIVKKISLKQFDEYVELVREFDEDLYKRYSDKINENNKINFAILVSVIKNLVSFLENGIKGDDGAVRKFDIIDYYRYVNINVDDLERICKGSDLNSKEYKLIREFIVRNDFKTKNFDVLEILNGVQEIGCKKDKNGNLIPGSGRIVDIAEKEKIIKYLKEIGVPLNKKNYYIAFRRCVNETLFTERNKGNNKK